MQQNLYIYCSFQTNFSSSQLQLPTFQEISILSYQTYEIIRFIKSGIHHSFCLRYTLLDLLETKLSMNSWI